METSHQITRSLAEFRRAQPIQSLTYLCKLNQCPVPGLEIFLVLSEISIFTKDVKRGSSLSFRIVLKFSRPSGGKAKIGIDEIDFFIKYFARIKPPIISPITTVKLFSSVSIVEKLFYVLLYSSIILWMNGYPLLNC